MEAQARTPITADAPRHCLARIREVQARWTFLHRLLAVSLAVAAFVVLAALAVAVDWFVRGGPAWRGFLLVLVVVGTVAFLVRATRGLWTRRDPDQAAVLLERHYPNLGGKLVTAVQLRESPTLHAGGTSPGLYADVVTRAEQAAGHLKAAEVLPGKPYYRRASLAWGLVILVLLIGLLNPALAALGAARLLTPWNASLQWPQRTAIFLAGLHGGDPIRVVRGGTFVLEGRAEGMVPGTGTLFIQRGEAVTERAGFEVAEDGAFTVRYRPVNADLTARVAIGDAQSPPVHVEMIPPPEVANVQAEIVFPEYTGLSPERRDDGNIQAPYGTEVRLRVAASKAIQAATLAWEENGLLPLRLVAEDVAEARFRVEETEAYTLHLIDRLGFENEEPVVYQIERTPNEFPRFERTFPSSNKNVSPRAVVPIQAEITDDYGVARVFLHYRRGESDQVETIPLAVETPRQRLRVEYLWSLEELELQPGDSLTWWLEARDEGEHLEPLPGESDWPMSRSYRLDVLSEPDLTRWLNDQVEQILDRLSTLEVLQGETTDAVARILADLEERPEDWLTEQTQSEKWRQDRLARNAARLADQLQTVAEDYAISRVGQPERVQRLGETADKLAQLAGATMPEIVLALDEAMTTLAQP